MKFIGAHLKKNRKWIFGFLIIEALYVFTLYFHKIEKADICYYVLLSAGCFFFLLCGDLWRFVVKCKKLEKMHVSFGFEEKDLPDPTNRIEEDYQEMIKTLQIQAKGKETNWIKSKKEIMDYFSVWVHQIKTPIAAMKLLLQSNQEEQGEIETQLFYIQQYVEMSLQFIRLGADSTDYVIKSCDLDKIIKEALHKYAKIFIRKKIILAYEPVNVYVLTDEKWLTFVVEQILSNALKYSKTGKITLSYDEANANLSIEDMGIGIAPEDLPRIFDKGYTGYNGRQDKSSTGIGLYLCKMILDKLGHKIRVESVLGEGTKVIISFDID